MGFFLETLISGLMTGMLYALVALGFVLIFKASSVFNFAQGVMVLFAALAMARLAEWIPQWTGIESKVLANVLAFIGAALLMFLVAWLIERLALRHLVNQSETTLLMATLGIAYLLEGVGQTVFGGDIYKIDIGMPKDPIFVLGSLFDGGLLVDPEDLVAAGIAAALVALLALFFQKTTTGRALRAVADDHQAAQSVGIPLSRIWVIVWCVAGVAALVTAGLGIPIVGVIPLATRDVLRATNASRMADLLDHPLLGPAYTDLARACLPNRALAPWRTPEFAGAHAHPDEPAGGDDHGADGPERRGLFRR